MDINDAKVGDNAVAQEGQTSSHWLWDNWILLAMLAMLSFTTCNLFIAEISDLGISSIYFFCSGSLLFSLCYFISKREWKRMNNTEPVGMLDAENAN